MKKERKTTKDFLLEIEDLRIRLDEAEETLAALRRGEVDGLVVSAPGGDQVFTLKGAERVYRLFVESMNEGAVTLSFDGTIVYCNDSFADIVDTPNEKIIGHSIYRFTSSPEVFEPAFQKGKTERSKAEILLKSKSDEQVPVAISFNPMQEAEVPGICMVVTDLTEHVRQEKLLQCRTDDLEKANAKLEKYNRQLEALNDELRDFAFAAAHDLQEPLRKIQTYSDMAIKRCGPALDSTGKAHLDRIVSSAGRMRQLLQDLLEFSRVAVRPGQFKEIDLGRMVREAVDLFEEDVKKSGGSIEIGDLPCIEADEMQMLRLFQNLLGNALKFRSRENPKIKIYSNQDGGRFDIFVEDNGIGFEQQFAEQIFKPFQRLHGQKKYGGTGIGLAVCRKVAELHGGSIRAESRPGKGSRFIINLPVKQVRREAYP